MPNNAIALPMRTARAMSGMSASLSDGARTCRFSSGSVITARPDCRDTARQDVISSTSAALNEFTDQPEFAVAWWCIRLR